MEAEIPQGPSLAVRVLKGIEAGILCGAAMLLVLIFGALWSRHVWWETPNLLATTFYGMRAMRMGPGLATWAGVALHFTITGTLGAALTVLAGGLRPGRHLVLLGAIAGFLWFQLADAVVWRSINPLVSLYAPQPVTMLSHTLFGACLGFLAERRRTTP